MHRHDAVRAALRKYNGWFLPSKTKHELNEDYTSGNYENLGSCMAFTVTTYSYTQKERVDVTFTVGLPPVESTADARFDGYCHDLYARGGGNGRYHTPDHETIALQMPSFHIAISENIRAVFAPAACLLKRIVYGSDVAAGSTSEWLSAFLGCVSIDYNAEHASAIAGVYIIADGLAVANGTRVCEFMDISGNVPKQYVLRLTREMLTRVTHAANAFNGHFCLIAPTKPMRVKSTDVATVKELLRRTEDGDEEGENSANKEITDVIVSATPDGARKTSAMVLITFEALHQGEE